MLGRFIKIVTVLAILAFLGLVAFMYLGDITPDIVRVTKPVVLDGN